MAWSRKLKRQAAIPLEDWDTPTMDRPTPLEIDDAFTALIRGLRSAERKFLTEYYRDGLSSKEMADLRGIKTKAVKNMRTQILSTLRKQLTRRAAV
jgi:DNA-directed RNA polymerase specialized sigma24 family protein